jgi:hypothetical protein
MTAGVSIVTGDIRHFRNSGVQVMTPAQFFSRDQSRQVPLSVRMNHSWRRNRCQGQSGPLEVWHMVNLSEIRPVFTPE